MERKEKAEDGEADGEYDMIKSGLQETVVISHSAKQVGLLPTT